MRVSRWLSVLGVSAVVGSLGVWAASCITSMPGESHAGALPALSDDDADLSTRLRAHVVTLATEIGERNAHRRREQLDRAALFVEQQFAATGLQVTREPVIAAGLKTHNVYVTLEGSGDELLVVGAHYDSAERTPGANDNASGVAVILELARLLQDRPGRTRGVRIVAFTNEEPPFFRTEAMGSRVHANNAVERGDEMVGMLSVETVGCYLHEEGTQRYPIPAIGLLYPTTGNFLGFVADLSSRAFARDVVRSFREHAAFPSEGVTLPSAIEGIDWSDHASFWRVGVPAVMVTDTALFRYDHYHELTDTPDRVDYEALARVTRGLADVVDDLAR